MTKLINTFHNSEAETSYTQDQLDDIEHRDGTKPWTVTRAERALIYRIRKQLCGIADCTCGNFWGARK